MSKALIKDVFRSIVRTKTRFLSIIAIVALGISVFAGIKATAPDLKETAEKYFGDNNLMDLKVLSTIGLTDADVYEISQISGVESVMPSKFADALIEMDGKGLVDIEGAPFSCRAYSLDLNMARERETGVDDAAYMNRVSLVEGELPKNPDECLVDGSVFNSTDKFKIGNVITLRGDRENLVNKLNITEFKIVGIIETPMYIAFERGNTLIGSGKLGNFIYIPQEAFSQSFYTEIYLTVSGADNYGAFTDEYNEYVGGVKDAIEGIAGQRVEARALSLSAELTPKVANGKAELAAKEQEAQTKLAEARALVEQIKYYAENGEKELAEKKAEYENSLSQAQKELLSGKDQYNAGMAEYNAKLEEYNAAKAIADQHPNARQEYNDAVQKLKEADAEIKDAEKRIADSKVFIKEAEVALDATDEETIREFLNRLEAMGIDTSMYDLVDISPEQVKPIIARLLDVYKVTLAESEKQLAEGKAEYAANKALVDAAAKDIAKLDELDRAYEQLKAAEQQLKTGQSDISMGEVTLSMKQMQLKYEVSQAEANLAQAKAKAATVDEEFAAEEAKVNTLLQNARYDLAAAENVLNSLDTAQWFITGRDDLPGHVEYGQSADNMTAFSAVFPVFFFLIAALVSLSTMARMVEEERVQLGTLKALGYGPGAIAAKYLIYAFIASVIGSAVGLSFGFVVFPKAIYDAYSIMFTTPPILLKFRVNYAIIGTVVAVLSTAAATLFACRKELAAHPATLMRPKPPKGGKRVFLEKVGFVWKKLNFTSKVTARNLLRNKKRFLMTLTGIAGCTALLLTGLGIDDSISAIGKKQFGKDGIAMYDAQFVLESDGLADLDQTLADLRGDTRLKDVMATYMKVLNGSSEEEGGMVMAVNILVPRDSGRLSSFVKLQNRRTGKQHELGDEGVLITQKFADKTGVKPGGRVAITLNDGSKVFVKVAGIVENYAFHYIYMTESLYEKTFGEKPAYNFVTAKLADSVKNLEETKRNSEKSRIATDLMKRDDISVVVYTSQGVESFDSIIKGLDALVYIFIGAAGLLAFLVLYNLSNININERVRELATIKVLGFYDREVSNYIDRENVVLTVLGMALGLLLGIPLHRFVISVAEVNIVMFGRSLDPSSFLIAAAATAVFAVLVNLLMHRKLKKLSMVESLKSVE